MSPCPVSWSLGECQRSIIVEYTVEYAHALHLLDQKIVLCGVCVCVCVDGGEQGRGERGAGEQGRKAASALSHESA